MASQVVLEVKNPPVDADDVLYEAWVQSLGREDPLEDGLATHSSILAWRIPWTEEPVMNTQSCLTLRDPIDCSPPGSSVHATQARILE